MLLSNKCNQKLSERLKSGNLRSLNVVNELVDFSSNDYLGLTKNEEFKSIIRKYDHVGHKGSTGSRLLTGNSKLAVETEYFLADLFKAESALIFNSGYTANLSVLSSLPQRGDIILYDELCHASIKDGMRLSNAKRYSFLHNDLRDLEKKLKKSSGDVYVMVESIYSMDGDECPLEELVTICKSYGAYIILDEAHATGIIGKFGGGLSELYGLEKDILCRIYTFGKSVGYHGAAIAGSNRLKEYLINFARPFIYSTALPEISYHIIRESLQFLTTKPALKRDIEDITQCFISEFNKSLSPNYERTNSNHPIQIIITKGNEKTKLMSLELKNAGYDIRPILAPTVKEGSERLRICLHNYNTKEEVSGVIKTIASL